MQSPALLVPIVLLALMLRLNGLQWDAGCVRGAEPTLCHLHPDERNITIVITSRILPEWPPRWGDLLVPERSPLNPRSDDPATGRPRDFAYGSLPLFVTKAIAGTMQALTGTPWTEYDRIVLVGRALSAVLDVGTLLLVYALARRYARWAGNVAALLFACCVLQIQLAHFFATDTWVTFFATAAVWAFVRAAERHRVRDFVCAGALVGLAVASKASVAFLAFPAFAALVVHAVTPDPRANEDADESRPLVRLFSMGLATAWAAVLAFAVAEPYALLRLGTYMEAIGTQARLVKGDLDYPYTRQYVGTAPYYHLKNLVLWGMGPALGLLALAGLVWGIVRVARTRRTVDWVLLAWVVPYLAYTVPQSVKFMRYLQPVYPVLIVLGVALIVDATRTRVRIGQNWLWMPRPVAFASLALVALCTALWAGAFSTIYEQTHSRVAGSEWFEANIPAGSVVATEVWDDGFPQAVSATPNAYDCVRLNAQRPSTCSGFDLYPDEGTGETRLRYLTTLMNQADYIVMSSNTVWGSIPHAPWRYPVTIRFYDLLFTGRLGYTTVYDGTVSPHLGAWAINDHGADQSFSYYDHPQVRVFKRTQPLTAAQLRPLFADVLAQPAVPQRDPPKRASLLTQDVNTLPPVNDRAWGGVWARNGGVAVGLYLLLFELFGLIGWPVAARIFRRFPDRGWGMAKPLGWLACAYVVWLGASLHIVPFTLPVVAAVVAGGIVIAAVVGWWNRALLWAHLRTEWRTMLGSELTALAGFALFLLFRLRNPDLWQTYWGGEKPFELAQLNGILRSASFPPYDPWLAGGTINYYYYGAYLHAFVMKLTGIAPEVAFNVAVPATMMLVWGAAFSVGSALWVLVRRRSPERGSDAVTGGICAAIAVALLGNLNAVGQVVALLRRGVGGREIGTQFDFWQSTRLIPGTINEFPFFSGLWADLHAHVVALPFALVCVGIALAIALHWQQPHPFGPRVPAKVLLRGVPWVSVAVAALVVGALYPINAWDFPTAIALIGIGIVVGLRQAVARWPVAVLGAAGGALGIAAAGYLLFLPFHRNFYAVFGSFAAVTVPSPPGEFGVIFGFFLVVIACGIAAASPVRGWNWIVMQDTWGVGVLVGTVALWLVSLVTQRWVLVCTVPLLGLLALLWLRNERQPARRMLFGLGIVGVGLVSVVEVVFLADDLIGGDYERMNTVFKFHFQAWTLFALAAVGFLSLVTDRWRLIDPVFRAIFAAFVGIGVLACLVYPVFGTQSRLAQRMLPVPADAGLNGNAWMQTGVVLADQWNNTGSGEPIAFRDDLALIDWMNANLRGTPVIAEAAIGPYRGNGSRISSATGFPAVIGWERHEEQQRGVDGLPERNRDVRVIYTATDDGQVQTVLDRYAVRYIVVGEVERRIRVAPNQTYASAAGLETLQRMEREGMLRVAWQQNGTILYEVMR